MLCHYDIINKLSTIIFGGIQQIKKTSPPADMEVMSKLQVEEILVYLTQAAKGIRELNSSSASIFLQGNYI